MAGIRQEGKVGEIIWAVAGAIVGLLGMIGLFTLVAYFFDRWSRP